MNSTQTILWQQFGGVIDMMEKAIKLCSDDLWKKQEFWYTAYHTLFFLDYYLDENPDQFMPPAPFTLSEFDPDGALPERMYNKDELLIYLEHCRKKCRQFILNADESGMQKRWINPYRDYSFFEMIIYNMRHVQHHTGQLNLLIRQVQNEGVGWVSRTEVS